jgi:glucan phosphoethanolaminetransferase (alkaline phosphatase superfamily)
MSSETRAAVLNSIRFKPEHPPSELLYVSLMAYALFTRTVADIEAYALPAFVTLVACYQIAGLLLQLSTRRLPDLWDIVYWAFGTTIFIAGYVLVIYGVVAIAVDVWIWLQAFWAELDPLANQTQFTVVTGLMTVTAGSLFFRFRLKQRFLYGLTEACVGVIVGMHRVTLEQWSGVPKSTGFYLALLTAGIYLVVRGLDNMHQAQRDGDLTLQRFARLVLRKSFPSKVTRRRVSQVRRTRMRKVNAVER